MTVETIPVTDRATWLGLRTRDLTASDIAAVAGADPSRSALRVYAEKTGKIPPSEDNEIMRRGRWLEAAVIEAMRDERPTWDIRRAGVYLRDPSIRLGATPDAVAVDPDREGVINIQCKVVSRPIFEHDWIDEKPPLKFQLQTLAEGHLIDAARNVIAALVVSTYTADLVINEVERHPGAEKRIREIASGFWANVDNGIEPAPVYATDAEVIASIYSKSVPTEIDLSGDNRLPAILAERAELKAGVKAGETRIKEIETEIKAKLGHHERGHVPGWRISWPLQNRDGYTVAPTSFRRLDIRQR